MEGIFRKQQIYNYKERPNPQIYRENSKKLLADSNMANIKTPASYLFANKHYEINNRRQIETVFKVQFEGKGDYPMNQRRSSLTVLIILI
jgi:hypothetical protein